VVGFEGVTLEKKTKKTQKLSDVNFRMSHEFRGVPVNSTQKKIGGKKKRKPVTRRTCTRGRFRKSYNRGGQKQGKK